MACPDEDDIVAFVEGGLDRSAATSIEAHIDDCEGCAQVVAGLVRIYQDDSSAPLSLGAMTLDVSETERSGAGAEDEDDGPVLAAGAQVGRYGVLECIGFGGMGVVYSAYDPELDRRVALKVLRGAGSGADELRRNARLLREAQAMAKLSHPNVITVHDVGNFEGRVFLAMEFVEGTTLGRWMRARPRSWKEIRAVFIAAGNGLAAAHDAGLVHRDFKPDNVLIGDNGRVRVTDFGLARFRDESIEQSFNDARAHEEILSGPAAIVGTLTKTGVLVGTPAYMAPEQYEGRTISAATDQFSFCVALFEALYGQRPFEGRTLAELATNVCAGRLRALRDAAVPSRVRDAVRRGLSTDRSDRYPSMQALLAVLGRRPSRTASRWAMVAVPTGLLIASYWWDSPRASAGVAFCRSEFDANTFWNGERRERLRAAFESTEAQQAEATAGLVSSRLDTFADEWARARDAVCEASDGDELPGNAVLKSHCLLRYRARFNGMYQAFSEADSDLVAHALGAAEDLPAPWGCTEDASVSAGLVPMPPPTIANEVNELREQLEHAVADHMAFRLPESLATAERVRDEAKALDYPPLVVEAQFQMGRVHARRGEYDRARRTLEETAWQAVSAHHRGIAAAAWIELIFLESAHFDDTVAARRAQRAAEAELAALGPVVELERRLQMHIGALAASEGRLEEAHRSFEEALETESEASVLRRADLVFNLAAVETRMGLHDKAIEGYHEYIETYETHYGRNSAALASGYYNLGATLFTMGRLEEAREQLEEARAIEDETLDPNHPVRADTFGALATVLSHLGRAEEATENFKRAVEVASQPGRGASAIALFHRLSLAEHYADLKQYDEAAATLAICRTEIDAAPEPDGNSEGHWRKINCDMAAAQGDLKAALRHCEEEVDAYARARARDEEQVATSRLRLAKLVERAGDHKYAAEMAEAVLGMGGLDTALSGEAAFILARQLWAQGKQARALTQARSALASLDDSDDQAARDEVAAWLAERTTDDAATEK